MSDSVWHEIFGRVYLCGLTVFCVLRELIFAISRKSRSNALITFSFYWGRAIEIQILKQYYVASVKQIAVIIVILLQLHWVLLRWLIASAMDSWLTMTSVSLDALSTLSSGFSSSKRYSSSSSDTFCPTVNTNYQNFIPYLTIIKQSRKLKEFCVFTRELQSRRNVPATLRQISWKRWETGNLSRYNFSMLSKIPSKPWNVLRFMTNNLLFTINIVS